MRQWESWVWQLACPRGDVSVVMKESAPLAWDHETLDMAWVTGSTSREAGQQGAGEDRWTLSGVQSPSPPPEETQDSPGHRSP